ncbi:DUF2806 domain-containing protein [Commensalibacter communis]|uniref:DUF2806 domain-containing protein n=1 Tax=Commensalibacter communis TaxID=2972786 RepID=UPI0022FFAC4F|nr:DUF2806 domain-containing protein [Commensalibacter communis]CAI3949217.1 unnamed protein product [Commensalibacter communis]CAI3949442.1 unnamed protein product [Commensalibacter communis]
MNDSKNPINVDVSVSAKADLAPIIKATPKGFKYLSFLLFGKREANLEKYVRLSKAQTDVDEKGVLEGRLIFNAKENTLLPTPQNLKEQIVGAIQDEEIQNLIACSIKAAENIKEGETEKEPSQDFINRWRNDAKQIHSEELQNIWGRLMAEEINNPNSISLRTLDVVKNISRSEAELFVQYLKYICNGRCLIAYKANESDPIHEEYRVFLQPKPIINRKDLVTLRDAGIIVNASSTDTLSGNWSPLVKGNKNIYYISTINYCFYVFADKVKMIPRVHFLEFSKAAQDIFLILRQDKNIRQYNKQDAIDFIEVIRQDLLDCGAKHIYFGYIENYDQIPVCEKYSL